MSGVDVFSAGTIADGVVEPTRELVAYLEGFRGRFGIDDVLRYVDGARPLRALVVGETIIDEYQYVETIGKSGKEPILAARYLSEERFAGGVLAVANQVATAVDRVVALSCLGGRDPYEEFVRDHLRPNVHLEPVYVPGATTIVKRRFVETYPLQKLFEVYLMDADEGEIESGTDLCDRLERELGDVDVVVVSDFGHGMLGDRAVELLCSTEACLAVNTQANAGNRGFNTVSKYRRADFISISEQELRLEARSRHRELRDIVVEVAERLGCERMIVTRGRRGCVAYGADGYHEVPGFVTPVIDRMGAGDAVLSLTSLLAAQGAPSELIGVVGNVVGANAVGIVGNSDVVGLDAVAHTLRGLLA